jgi:hypothetical protein
MATRFTRSILSSEMVVGTHIERHSFILRFRRRRGTIEGLGIGRRLLLSPSVTPKVRPPELAFATSSREGISEPLYTDRVRSTLRRSRSGKASAKATNG